MTQKTKRAAEATQSVRHNKDNVIENQMQIVYRSFLERPKTMFEVEKETGVVRPNICRYVQMMEESGTIQMLYKTLCPVSNFKAGFYTTNKELFSNNIYPSLFDEEYLHGLHEVGPIVAARINNMRKEAKNGRA